MTAITDGFTLPLSSSCLLCCLCLLSPSLFSVSSTANGFNSDSWESWSHDSYVTSHSCSSVSHSRAELSVGWKKYQCKGMLYLLYGSVTDNQFTIIIAQSELPETVSYMGTVPNWNISTLSVLLYNFRILDKEDLLTSRKRNSVILFHPGSMFSGSAFHSISTRCMHIWDCASHWRCTHCRSHCWCRDSKIVVEVKMWFTVLVK